MAQVILSAAGGALFGPVGAAVGAVLGQVVDTAALNALTPARQVGPRIPELRLTGAARARLWPACSAGPGWRAR